MGCADPRSGSTPFVTSPRKTRPPYPVSEQEVVDPAGTLEFCDGVGGCIHLFLLDSDLNPEAASVRGDYARVIAEIEQGSGVTDAALNLSLSRAYVEALLRTRAP